MEIRCSTDRFGHRITINAHQQPPEPSTRQRSTHTSTRDRLGMYAWKVEVVTCTRTYRVIVKANVVAFCCIGHSIEYHRSYLPIGRWESSSTTPPYRERLGIVGEGDWKWPVTSSSEVSKSQFGGSIVCLLNMVRIGGELDGHRNETGSDRCFSMEIGGGLGNKCKISGASLK